MQISVQLYSVRKSFAADPVGTLRRLAEFGLSAPSSPVSLQGPIFDALGRSLDHLTAQLRQDQA